MFGQDGLHKLEDKTPEQWRQSAIYWERKSEEYHNQVLILKAACEKVTETTGPNYENWSRHFLLGVLEQIKQGE